MQRAAGSAPFRLRLRHDSAFRLEVGYTNKVGIPHSWFKEWSDADQAKALAYELEQASVCQMCGTAEWEWDPEQGGKRGAYEPVEHRCMGCYAKETRSEQSKRAPGVTITLQRTDSAEAKAARKFLEELRRRDAEDDEDDEDG